MPEIHRGKTACEQIHDELSRLIAEGRLTEGQRVPSVRELAEEWNVSPGTADCALRKLAAAKLVTRDHRGTFVAAGRLVPGPQMRYRMTGQRLPGEQVQVTDAALLEQAPEYVQAILDLDTVPVYDLVPVIRREEVRFDQHSRPVSLQVEWIPPRFAEACPELAMAAPLPFAGGAIALIEARTGTRASRGRESHEARMPLNDGREIPLLGLVLDKTAPVLGQVWVWFDSAGTPICYTELTVMADRVIESEFDVSQAEIR